jgi:2-polyprenyl-6-methoxyphenol hydroxylase-like FAD-dependent oxidoreductase
MNPENFPESASYDVVVIGGALSGAATATLLVRQNPGIRVLIVEKSEKLTRRVGEATVEIREPSAETRAAVLVQE